MGHPALGAAREVEDLVSLTESEPIRSDDAEMCGQRVNVVLPGQFRARAILTTVDEDDRVAVAAFEVVGADPVDDEEPRMDSG